jgi:Holliday junction DNA helicase RuvA
MIAYLDGRLVHKDPTYALIDVQGIGYEVRISLNTYSRLKPEEKCRILTHLHIKEDSHTLYGFMENDEKRLFLQLISVSGIGPGTALMMLSSLSASDIQNAIVQEDVRLISSVKGIGAKTAQRVILELRDKIGRGDLPASGAVVAPTHNTVRSEALSALTTLGINRAAAEKNIDTILKKNGTDIKLEDLIKLALKNT